MTNDRPGKLRLFHECEELNLAYFECPSFLFIFTGFITIVFILSTFFISRLYYSEAITIGSIMVVATVMVVISFIAHVGTNKVAQSKKILAEANAKLEQSIAKMKELDKVKEEFTYTLVHDLRSPLNGMCMLSEMLLDKLKVQSANLQDANVYHESLHLINYNAGRMLELVNDLLDVAKLESGKFKIEKQIDNLPEVVSGVISYYQTLADHSQIKLSWEKNGEIPPFSFDRRGVEQVLHNLISNALKFTKAGGWITASLAIYQNNQFLDVTPKTEALWPLIRDDARLAHLPPSVLVIVSDNGCGIPADQLSKLFNRFAQVKTCGEPTAKGTGLGLSICKGIIEAHQGIIGVRSDEGKGSSFYFSLPLK